MNRLARKTVLDNGIRVVTVFNPAADIVAARLFLRAGSAFVPLERAGLVNLLAALMTKGSDRHSSMDIAEQVESLGAGLAVDVAMDYFFAGLKSVSADFLPLLDLVAHLLRSPSFVPHELELERRAVLQAIRAHQEQPFAVAFEQLRRALYGDRPYGVSGLGTADTVTALTRGDLQNFHRRFFRPDNLAIGIAGRIDPDTAVGFVEKTLGDWPVPPEPLALPTPVGVDTRPHAEVCDRETQQLIVMLGHLAPSLAETEGNGHRDYVGLKLLSTYLGTGLSSRLFVELREKRGLAYDVGAFYPTQLIPSQFVTYIGTAPGNARDAFEGLRRELDRLRNICLDPEELAATQHKLLGQYALGKQTNAQLAHLYGWYECLGLGLSFDETFVETAAGLSAATLRDIARRYWGAPYLSLVGPGPALETVLETANEVDWPEREGGSA